MILGGTVLLLYLTTGLVAQEPERNAPATIARRPTAFAWRSKKIPVTRARTSEPLAHTTK